MYRAVLLSFPEIFEYHNYKAEIEKKRARDFVIDEYSVGTLVGFDFHEVKKDF